MTLGDHVRVTKVFADAFSGATRRGWEEVAPESSDWSSSKSDASVEAVSVNAVSSEAQESIQAKRDLLAKDLGVRLDLMRTLWLISSRSTKTLSSPWALKMSDSVELHRAQASSTAFSSA